jgi:dipeptidyl aminopeptidase/acylaminoacyl peptidase
VRPIPLSLVRAGRELTEPRVSPDGRFVGFVQRWRGATSINVVSIGGGSPERMLTFGPDPKPGRGLGGACFTWLPDSTEANWSVVYAAGDGELWRQSGLELDRITAHARDARCPSVDSAGRFLAYVVDEAEVWLLDLVDGGQRRLDDGRHEFGFDATVSSDGSRVAWTAWSPPDMPWDGSVRMEADVDTGEITVVEIPYSAMQQPRFTDDGRRAQVHDASGWLNVYLDDEAIVAEPAEHAGPTWGMGNRSYAIDPTGQKIAFTRNERGHGSLRVVDLATQEVTQLGRGVHGHVTWAGDAVVALRSGARTPTQIVRYDARGERTTLVMSQPGLWPLDQLPEPDLVEEPSADGTFTLHARRFAAEGAGRMLVWVHGGPTDQWQVEWRPRITYWWSRGWDVLVVDPRGTTGHGRDYQQGLHGAWGRADVDDTATLIRRAQREGWATSDSTVVIGGSSGGLTVLGVLADHPDLVAGGIASYPVSDLKALTEATHRFEAHYTDTLVAPLDGSVESEERFRELSPVSRAEHISPPLLVMHGTDDPVVPFDQSVALVARIREAGGDAELVTYHGEGHGFRDPENVADEYDRTERFLDRLVPRHR